MEHDYNEREHMTLGDWIITFLILCVPCVNIVMIFVWAFSSDTNPSKKTFFQAVLIVWATFFCISLMISMIGATSGIIHQMTYHSAIFLPRL